MPMISERKRTTLVDDPLPTLETAKKNCMERNIVRKGTGDSTGTQPSYQFSTRDCPFHV